MKKNSTLLFILSLTMLFSCRSSKDLIYLKDAVGFNSQIKGLSNEAIEHILKPGDILYVSIKSMNVEVNALFNPESNMESMSSMGYQKYATPSGAYLYGFEIDPNGLIKLPMLGSLKVDGVPVSQVEAIVQKKADEYIKSVPDEFWFKKKTDAVGDCFGRKHERHLISIAYGAEASTGLLDTKTRQFCNSEMVHKKF